VLKGRESFPHARTDGCHCDDVGKAEVAHDCPTHDTPPDVIALYEGGDKEGHGEGPGDALELLPEPVDDQGDVEAKDKSDRDQTVVRLAVHRDAFKYPFSFSFQNKAIQETQQVVENSKDCKISP